MKINCYQNFKKRSNETLQPTGAGTEKDVVLKNATSITNPTFILSGFDPTMNYIVVPSWGRKYFVVDYQKGNNDLYEVQCEEDYAGTWKDDIASLNTYVERTSDSSQYNVDIQDNALSVEGAIEYSDEAVTPIFSGTTGCYIARIVGRDTSGVATYVFQSLSEIGRIFNPVYQQYFQSGDWSTLNIGDFIQAFLCDPSKYLVGAYYSPISSGDYTSHVTSEGVNVGFFPTNVVGARITSPLMSGNVTINKPSSQYSDFRTYDSAFSQYTLYLPGVGSVSVSPDNMKESLVLHYAIDLLTGDIFYRINTDGLISTYNGNIYASLQLSKGDASGGGSFLSGAVGTAVSVAGGSALGAVSGAIETTKSLITPTPSINGSQSGVASLREYPDIILSVTQKSSGQFPVNQVGRPCCKNLTLGNLSGYIKCGNASIDISGTKTEKDAVNNLLNSGFYFT